MNPASIGCSVPLDRTIDEDRFMHVDALTLFGLAAVSLMLVFYALEQRSPIFVLGFAISCVLASLYGFLQGAWPFGLVEGIWSLVALRRWWHVSAKET